MTDPPLDPDLELLRRIDAYLDTVPRSVAEVERIGPFTLFVNEGPGWRYYARPAPGADAFAPADVDAVRARQRARRQPEAFEWVVQLTPGVEGATAAAGMRILHHPLMHLDVFVPAPAPTDVEVVRVSPEDDLARFQAVAQVGFDAPRTGAGRRDVRAYETAVASADLETVRVAQNRMRDGFSTMAAAMIEDRPVAVGSYQPRDGVAEITGVATLPGYRRRGLAAAVTSALVEDARREDVRTIFLSADDDDVARIYARIGFRVVGTAGEANVAAA
jgi:ribosomal protein S18 acetylase RimI-like enzyme